MSLIIERGEWGMPGPLGPPMRLPATTLYVHHSVTPAANGVSPVRQVANIGIRRFGRASYSYAVTPDGTVYEMQGDRVGAHTAGRNSSSFGVVLVGNYDERHPTGAQLDTVARLYVLLGTVGMLEVDAGLFGHRDAPGAATACPGRHVYAALPAVRARAAELLASPAVPPPPASPVPEEDPDMARVLVKADKAPWFGYHVDRHDKVHVPDRTVAATLVASGQLLAKGGEPYAVTQAWLDAVPRADV